MKDNIIYKRVIHYHDKDNTPQSSVLEITTRNNYVEFTMCNPDCQSDFNPKDGLQNSLHHLWKTKHLTKICNLEDIEATKIFTEYLNDLCDAIEKEEEQYLESLKEMTEEDVLKETCDERLIALIKHLGIDFKEYEDITEAKYGYNIYEYGSQEYQVLTDDEADDEEREYVEQLIEECYLSDLTRNNKNHPALQFIDMDAWLDSWCGNRGENLNSYDSCEHDEEVNGTTYYIYRKN